MNSPQFTIQTQSQKLPHFAEFVIEPLPQGFGHTLGNSLRRVLYTSIPGSAITSVRIAGINHQFTTIPGIKEDITQLILALKEVAIEYRGDQPVAIGLSAKGTGPVTASQFRLPPNVKIANPQLVIANLGDKNAKLEIVAIVESGLGYSPAEERKVTTLGTIAVDALFTPVVRVNYQVENTRVGRITNFDRLIFGITTNGTVTPSTALEQAAQILVNFFSAVVHPIVSPSISSPSPPPVSPSSMTTISVEELNLPTRISNALEKAGIETVADLLDTPKSQLAKIKNLGSKSVKIIDLAVNDRGFELTP